MLNVFFTVDVEIWCKDWDTLNADFPDAFRRYVYGPTPKGDFGLPYITRMLADHGLTGVFFVEPLFATCFGVRPLAEIVHLLRERDQHIELHLHTEWVDESREPLLEDVTEKRQNLRDFSLEEQTVLIAAGVKLLGQAGVDEITAFRAGNFGFNRDTLRALAANGIKFDSSYNATRHGLESGVLPGSTVVEPVKCESVFEYPMTVFKDGISSLRHTQITACSFKELKHLLWQALDAERKSFVILAHNFEMLNQAKTGPDKVVVKRFKKLCEFLDKNRDSFRMRGFRNLKGQTTTRQPPALTSPIWNTAARTLEQASRRVIL